MPALIDLNLEEFERLCREHELTTNRQIADALGVDISTVHRVRAGNQTPGAVFIDGAVALFGTASYSRLFGRRREEVAPCES